MAHLAWKKATQSPSIRIFQVEIFNNVRNDQEHWFEQASLFEHKTFHQLNKRRRKKKSWTERVSSRFVEYLQKTRWISEICMFFLESVKLIVVTHNFIIHKLVFIFQKWLAPIDGSWTTVPKCLRDRGQKGRLHLTIFHFGCLLTYLLFF